jgi:flagellar biosynthesis protein FlhG
MDQARHLRDMVEGRKEIQRIPLIQHGDMRATAQRDERVRVISVTSGKGGVGKTNVVANLAMAMGKMGKRVLILDADLGLANMDILLGLNPKFTIQHVISGERRLQEVILSTPGGCHLLPAASGIQELTDLDYSQRLFLLNELDALQDQFDILLIDTGAGISANVMYFNFAAMERIVVVTNEPTSMTDAYALIKVLTKKYRQRKFKILVNIARNPEEGLRIFKQLSLVVDRFLGSPSMDYLGCVQHDENVPRSVRQQQTVVQRYPTTRASKDFIELAERMLSEDSATDFEGDIKFFWQRLLSC